MPLLHSLRRALLLALYRLLYHELAWAYDAVSWAVSGGLWWRWTRVALRFVAAEPVVEIAPGPGHLLRALRRAGHRAYGVERSAQMCRLAAGRNGPGAVLRGDVYRLPLRPGSAGTIVATFPPPFAGDPAALRELARARRPGGRLVIVDAARPPASHLAGKLAMLLLCLGGVAAAESAADQSRDCAGLRFRRYRVCGPFGAVWIRVADG